MTRRLSSTLAGCLGLAASLWLAGCQLGASNNVKVDYYAISGNSTDELESEIRRKGPRIGVNDHAVAVARIKMFPDVRYRRKAGRCSVRSAKVAVKAHVTLPRWTRHEGASRKLSEAWDNMDRYTRLHEAVHVAIAFRYAKQMEETLLELDAAPSCKMTKAKAEAIIRSFLSRHDTAQRQFDKDERSRFSAYAQENPSSEKIDGS